MSLLWQGDLEKMRVSIGKPVTYRLGEHFDVNALIGQRINMTFTGNIHCCVCSKKIPKVYGEGYCYPHFRDDPANAPCVVRPELCEAHEGRGRDPDWERDHHVTPHVVYLADSGGIKVGVTRAANTPDRWIDQGAHRALVIAQTPYRQLAGLIEVGLKGAFGDKTNWRRMLTGACDGEVDLAAARARAAEILTPELAAYLAQDAEPVTIAYPLGCPPDKVQSINLAKTPEVEARLEGIRGQYLIFEGGLVCNIRRHTGFEICLSTCG